MSSRCEALAADIEDVGASRNVRRRLLGSHSSMPINANVCIFTDVPFNILDPVRLQQIQLLLACRSDVPVNASNLLMSSGERLPATGIIRSHGISDGTVVSISRIFDQFRNMGTDNC
ncbi:hypothetical protein Tco_0714864 [Tanacetum coccineum]